MRSQPMPNDLVEITGRPISTNSPINTFDTCDVDGWRSLSLAISGGRLFGEKKIFDGRLFRSIKSTVHLVSGKGGNMGTHVFNTRPICSIRLLVLGFVWCPLFLQAGAIAQESRISDQGCIYGAGGVADFNRSQQGGPAVGVRSLEWGVIRK